MDNNNKQKDIINKFKASVQPLKNRILNVSDLKAKLELVTLYKNIYSIKEMSFDLGNNYLYNNGQLYKDRSLKIRGRFKSRRGKVSYKESDVSRLILNDDVVLVKSKNDNNLNNLGRRLNFYLENNPNKILLQTMEDIPFESYLFKTIIDSTTLPKPVVVKGARVNGTPKMRTDATVFKHYSKDNRMRMSLNTLSKDQVYVKFQEDMNFDISNFFYIVDVPKCNLS